jgi:hypothetical protein
LKLKPEVRSESGVLKALLYKTAGFLPFFSIKKEILGG